MILGKLIGYDSQQLSGLDAKYQYIPDDYNGLFYYSHNYGVSWSSYFFQNLWNRNNIYCSPTGQYVYVSVPSDNGIYRSADYGLNFSFISIPGTISKLVTSKSGQYVSIVVSSGGSLYVSSNYGASFTDKAIESNWQNITMSHSGQYQVALGYSGTIMARRSTDYGDTWLTCSGTNMNLFRNSVCSADGSIVLAVRDNSGTPTNPQLSTNYGQNFTQITSISTLLSVQGISMSYSGQYMTLSSTSGVGYISENSGVSWSSPVNFHSALLSGDGQYMFGYNTLTPSTVISQNYLGSFNTSGAIPGSGTIWSRYITDRGWMILARGDLYYISTDQGNSFSTVEQFSGAWIRTLAINKYTED